MAQAKLINCKKYISYANLVSGSSYGLKQAPNQDKWDQLINCVIRNTALSTLPDVFKRTRRGKTNIFIYLK